MLFIIYRKIWRIVIQIYNFLFEEDVFEISPEKVNSSIRTLLSNI